MTEVLYTADAPYLLNGAGVFRDQVLEVDPDDPTVQALLESGALKPTKGRKPPTKEQLAKRAKRLGVEGHSKLDRNELAEAIAHAKGEREAAKDAIDLEGEFHL